LNVPALELPMPLNVNCSNMPLSPKWQRQCDEGMEIEE
jgi:hypothetical protein